MKPIFILLLLSILLVGSATALTDTIDVRDYEVEYSYDADDVLAGETFRLSVTLTNTDDKNHTDIEFTLDEDSTFTVSDDDFDIDVLEPDESKSKTFRVKVDKDAKADDYDLDFTIDDDDDDYDDSFDIEVDSIIPELIIGDIQIKPTTLLPDLEDIELIVTFENIGDGDARFVRIDLDVPKGFTPSNSYSDTENLGTLVQGDRKEATFYIDTDANLDEGKYGGTFTLVYEDEEGNERTDQLTFDLPVRGKPLFSIVDAQLYPQTLFPGTEGTMQITIKNVGSEDAEETSLRIFENSDLPFEFVEKTNFIGTIDAGDTGTAVFKFEVDGNAATKKYNIKLQTRTVNQGDVVVDEKSLNVPVQEPPQGNTGMAVLLIVGILVVLGLTIWILISFIKKKE